MVVEVVRKIWHNFQEDLGLLKVNYRKILVRHCPVVAGSLWKIFLNMFASVIP